MATDTGVPAMTLDRMRERTDEAHAFGFRDGYRVAEAALRKALQKAAVDFVWTLYARDQHDNEGHDLPAVERYMVRRWLRAAALHESEARDERGLDIVEVTEATRRFRERFDAGR